MSKKKYLRGATHDVHLRARAETLLKAKYISEQLQQSYSVLFANYINKLFEELNND